MSAERAVRRWVDGRSGDSGIGAAGAGVLFHLAAHDGALVGEVTAALNASAAGTSGLVNRLAAAGLLRKTPDPADARAVRLSLTPRGREVEAAARSILAELNELLVDGFTPEELATVARWLARTTELSRLAAR
ncbi:MarR family transcriptional regulator [Blastococcus sp. TF02A-30]|nr:MarR family transcriptional regulator [Blastococcus sp. TF02A-30]